MNKMVKFIWVTLSMLAMLPQLALADYVGEVQTTKYLDTPTINMITARYQAGQPGLKVGDEISYIIQFTPTDNGGIIGAGGYVTDYIPAGTEVVNAQFVRLNGDGTSTQIAPPAPAEVMAAYVPLYSETGIFYSTDPRTSKYTTPASPTLTAANGYPVLAGGCGGISLPSNTHNSWDNQMMATYGAAAQGAAAYTAALGSSPVAGPDALLKNDYQGLASVGPWKRISYPGSYIGTMTGTAGPYLGFVGGTPTTAGWVLSSSSPLPSNTNAVRFAAGRVTVGELFSVRITLRITQPVSSTGLINNTEVFGGDSSIQGAKKAGQTAKLIGKDNMWKYHCPAVANADTTLTVLKRVVGMCTGVGCIPQPFSGGAVPSMANLKLRYEILYLNSSGGPQTGVVISDLLPAGGVLVAGSEKVVTGANILPVVANATGFTFQTLATLGSGGGGVVQFDVSFAAAPAVKTPLSNTVTMTSLAVPGGVKSVMTVTPTLNASLAASKTTSTPSVAPGGTATYSISVPNLGAGAATGVVVDDYLPSTGAAGVAGLTTTRFSYQAPVAIAPALSPMCPAAGGVGAITLLAGQACGTITAANGVVTPVALTVTSAPVVAAVAPAVTPPADLPYVGKNREKVSFTLPATAIVPGCVAPATACIPMGGKLDITFNSTVGGNIAASTAAYTNDLRVTYLGGFAGAAVASESVSSGTAPVSISIPLTLSMGIDCVYSGTNCVAYSGGTIPSLSKVRYRLSYANTGSTTQANVVLTDTLPANITFVSGTAQEDTANGNAANGIVPPTVATPLLTFGTITSLPANSKGAVTFDAQLPCATAGVLTCIQSGTNFTNTAKVVSGNYPGGGQASLTTTVSDDANLTVTKTTSTPTLVKCSAVNVPAGCGTASYTITVTNTGSTAANNIIVYDELPFTGTVANPLTRFNFVSATVTPPALPSTLASVLPTTALPSVPPAVRTTLIGYNNLNQQEIKWTFAAAQTLAPGASFTITYTAAAGANIPAGSTVYPNSAIVSYMSGTTQLYASALNTAQVTIPSNLAVTTTIDCVYDALGACNAYDNSGIIPVPVAPATTVKVRYKMHYQNTGTAAKTNVYLCNQITSTQAAPAFTATITTPAIAPTPTGPFTNTAAPNGPPVVAPATAPVLTNPAVAACGFAAPVAPVTGVSFNYPVIPSLAAGASGDVYYDIATTAAADATITDTGKMTISQNAAVPPVATPLVAPTESESSTVTVLAKNIPALQITKATSTPNVAPGGTVTYTITIKNTGNAATTALKVFDFLPYSGTVLDAIKRFVYGANGTLTCLPAPVAPATCPAFPVAVAVAPPTQSPFSSNANQEQVLWDFGALALAAGSSVSFTFNATVGSAVPMGNYDNNVRAEFTSLGGPGSSNSAFTDTSDRVVVGASLDHIRLDHGGTGVTCTPSPITITAYKDATTVYKDTAVTVTLSPAGAWVDVNGVALSPANQITTSTATGTATAYLKITTPQSVTLSTNNNVNVGAATKCFVGGTANCAHVFSDAGFIFSATAGGVESVAQTPLTAGVPANFVLRAVKKNTVTQACDAALTGAQTVGFAYECNDPTTCGAANSLKVGGVAIGGNNNDCGGLLACLGGLTYGNATVTFDGNGNAVFDALNNLLTYEDVGNVTLHVGSKVLTNGKVVGTASGRPFRVNPHHFEVMACTAGAACAVANASPADGTGGVFARAGQVFQATVRAMSGNNNVTPSYGSANAATNATETVKLSRALVAPAVGRAGVLSGAATVAGIARSAFIGGVATTAVDLAWDDVGVITLSANAPAFMGAAVATAGTSGNVGRFIPDHFDTVATGPMACVAGAGCVAPVTTTAYSGQAFSGATVTARNAAGGTTANYQGAFAKAVTLSAVASNGGAAIGAVAPGGALAGTAVAAATFATGVGTATPTFTFAATPTTPTNVFIRAVENAGDGVTSLTVGTEGGTRVVSGRIRISNAHGSELLPLPIMATAQFWTGTSWVTNAADSATSFNTNLSTAGGNIVATIVKGLAGGVAVNGAGAVTLVNGVATFRLTRPGVTGGVDISLDAPAYLTRSTGRATFGVYKGNNEFIYLREAY